MNKKKIFLASDHAGFLLKKYLIEELSNYYDIADLGTNNTESCDYPIFAKKLVDNLLVLTNKEAYGILVCGTGVGMSIASNRNRNIRAALCFNEEMSIASRKHNDANVIVFGARIINDKDALKCVKAFLNTKFDGGRHERRLKEISKIGDEL